MKKVYIDDEGRIFEGEMAEFFDESDGFIEEIRQELDEKNTKGENIMNRLFRKSGKTKVVGINKEDGKIKRKAKLIKDITVMSVKGTFNDPWTYGAVGSVALQQGLKYKGDFKAGGKAGLATAAVLTGFNVAGNIVINMDTIKEA